MTRNQKKMLGRIIVSAVFLAAVVVLDKLGVVKDSNLMLLVLYLVPYFTIGWDVLWRAVRNIAHGQVFDENILMVIATVGALCIGFFPSTEEQNAEAVFVMIFYQVGELFQSIAVGKSRSSISGLMDIRPDCAYIERDGSLCEVDPEEVAVGDIITVRPGEKVPLDGTVESGSANLDTSMLTGESVPVEVTAGDSIISGSVNMNGVIRLKVTKLFEESTVAKILELVENSSENKSRSENFITRFARIYTPAVVLAAVAVAFIPPILTAGTYAEALPSWIIRALSFLVISCPCALVISVPLSFFGGIGCASKNGVLVKGSNYLEALSKAETVVFDKTGTLTNGTFSVTDVVPAGVSRDELVYTAAYAEAYSDHPIAAALKKEYGKEIDLTAVTDTNEVAGHGVRVKINGNTVLAGNAKLMAESDIEYSEPNKYGTVVHVAKDGTYLGYIVISDTVKPTSANALRLLKECGVKRTVMLTGDRAEAAEVISREVGIDEYRAGLLPAEKVGEVEKLLAGTQENKILCFVGDGINDAPVLMRADVGIAMGGIGSDAAIEAADIVLMDDNPEKISCAISIARRTLKIVRQNIGFALAVKGIILLLGIIGFAPIWLAVFADVGVAVIVILNAMRTLRIK